MTQSDMKDEKSCFTEVCGDVLSKIKKFRIVKIDSFKEKEDSLKACECSKNKDIPSSTTYCLWTERSQSFRSTELVEGSSTSRVGSSLCTRCRPENNEERFQEKNGKGLMVFGSDGRKPHSLLV